jgi:hypothetical protein
MLLTSKVTGQGNAITATMPDEVGRKLGLWPGDELLRVAETSGGDHVIPLGGNVGEAGGARGRHPRVSRRFAGLAK